MQCAYFDRQTDRQTDRVILRRPNERLSNIELLKILAIFLIIISHMNQTLTAYSATTTKPIADYIINLQEFILSCPLAGYFLHFFSNFGALGNDIFFVCSAWFLTDPGKTYGKKIVRLIIEVWFVSISILAVVLVSNTVKVNGATILRCLFPTTFQNNWYITSYVLFLVILPFLNLVLQNLSPEKHLLFVLFTIIVCTFIDPFTVEWSSSIIRLPIDEWVIVFFLIAYIKKYLAVSSLNIPINLSVLLAGMAAYGITAYSNAFAAEFEEWPGLCKIFVINWQYHRIFCYVIAIALFNLLRNIKFHSGVINQVSRYSLLIYVIHENLLIRKYYRPMVLTWIHDTLGYNQIILWIVILAIATLLGATFLSAIVDVTIGKLSIQITDLHYPKFHKCCSRFLDKLVTLQ